MPDIGPGWREQLPEVLDELADAWRDPAAWTGMTRAGGVDLPGAVAGAVVADELVFGPVVPVPDDAPLLDRALGLSGRDPGWKP